MIELLFDNDFGLSGSEIKSEDAYCYRGEACLTKELVEHFRSKPVSYSGFSLDESEGSSERGTGDT